MWIWRFGFWFSRGHIFLDIASTTFKFSGNVHFINWKSHAKYYGCVSTGRDATPRVPIHIITPVCRSFSFTINPKIITKFVSRLCFVKQFTQKRKVRLTNLFKVIFSHLNSGKKHFKEILKLFKIASINWVSF